ncbi:MAG: multiheme c-type cytochrome, partial [Candidatus Krumholzibacteriia bacterium]
RMEFRQLIGLRGAPLLVEDGPSGVRRCLICHERQYFQWSLTGHAKAMRTLQASGDDTNPDCVGCHVVGWDEPGGYDARGGARALLLKDVQCESCHGNGGPHLGSPTRIEASTCSGCHDEKHSLRFDFGTSRALVTHDLAGFGRDPGALERAAAAREAAKKRLLRPPGAFVGAGSCRACHEPQYASWLGSRHRRARDSVSGPNRLDPLCLGCHTTGRGRPWKGAREHDPTPDLRTAGVQCEACHGPGESHLEAKSPEEFRATIIGLGAKCAQCVIRQVCTSCHDQANDPSFDLGSDLARMQQLCKPQ